MKGAGPAEPDAEGGGGGGGGGANKSGAAQANKSATLVANPAGSSKGQKWLCRHFIFCSEKRGS